MFTSRMRHLKNICSIEKEKCYIAQIYAPKVVNQILNLNRTSVLEFYEIKSDKR